MSRSEAAPIRAAAMRQPGAPMSQTAEIAFALRGRNRSRDPRYAEQDMSSFVHPPELDNDDGGLNMDNDNAIAELDRLQEAYKAAVEEWIAAIKHEEALASVNHDVAEIDEWEAAHFKEDEMRDNVLAAKKEYEDALRAKLFNF
jgi:hypothetical protein